MNTQINTKKTQGFTIIEVVLVLAIAGLIFLMVFLALPALQRSQRDTTRREDASRFMSQIQSYKTNNNGKVPAQSSTALEKFGKDYLKWDADANNSEFVDPQSGESYKFKVSGDADTDTIQYRTKAECNGENFKSNSKARSVAVQIKLEGSGYYCQDNQ